MVDLHSHSTASDGRLSPTDLVALAATRRLAALALTDHDTVAGLTEAQTACQGQNIRFVPGIEIEVEVEAGEFHLLGLGLTQWQSGWVDGIAELQSMREDRNRKIFAKMTEAGIKGDFEEVRELAEGGQVGRPHFARFLVNRGKVRTIQDAFTHFLGRGQLFYERKAALPVDRAIALVHAGGGKAVVAHPMSLQMNWVEMEEAFGRWKDVGLDGIEAWHPGAEPRQCRRLEGLAVRWGLHITAGSDYHGDNRPDRKLGLTSGGRPIDDHFLEDLLPC